VTQIKNYICKSIATVAKVATKMGINTVSWGGIYQPEIPEELK